MIDIYVITIKKTADSEGNPLPLYEHHWEYLIRDHMNNCHSFKSITLDNIDSVVKFGSIEEAEKYYKEESSYLPHKRENYDISSLRIKQMGFNDCVFGRTLEEY